MLKEDPLWRLYTLKDGIHGLDKFKLQKALVKLMEEFDEAKREKEKEEANEAKSLYGTLVSVYEGTTDSIYRSLASSCDWSACYFQLLGLSDIKDLYPKPDPDMKKRNESKYIAKEWFYDARVYTLQFCILRISLAWFCWFIDLILLNLDLNDLDNMFETFISCFELFIYVLAYWVVEHFMKDYAKKILEVQEVCNILQ